MGLLQINGPTAGDSDLTFTELGSPDKDQFTIGYEDGSDSLVIEAGDSLSHDGGALYILQSSPHNVGIGGQASSAEGDILKLENDGKAALILYNNDDLTDGDPMVQFQVEGGETFAIGIDDGDGDKFKISHGADLGTSTLVTLDHSNTYMGVGTSSPDKKLEVQDSAGAQLRLTHEDGVDTTDFQTTDDGHLLIAPSGKNVSIGGSTAQTLLDAYESDGPDLAVRNDETINYVSYMRFLTGGQPGGVPAAGNTVAELKSIITQADPSTLMGELAFFTNQGDSLDEAMRIDDHGNLGIDITEKLSRMTIVGAADETNIGGTTTAFNNTTITGSGTSFLSDLGIGDRISLSSAPTTYATVTAIASDTSLTVDTALGDGTSQTINAKHGILRAENSSNAAKLFLSDEGSLMLGTLDPDYFNNAQGMVIYRSGGQTELVLVSDNDEVGRLNFVDTTGSSNEQGSVYYNHNTDMLTLAAGGTGAVNIDSSQDVGIGITEKLSRLTVQGKPDKTNIGGTTTAFNNTTITGSGTSFLSDLGIGDRISLSSQSSTYATVTAIASDTSLTVDTALGDGTSQTINAKYGIIRGENSANSVNLFVSDEGALMLGTLDPDYFNNAKGMVIYRTGGQTELVLVSDNDEVGRLNFVDTTGSSNEKGSVYYNHNTDMLTLSAGGTGAINIDSSQNVGIGNSSPNEKLEVTGAIVLGAAAGTNEGTIQWVTGTKKLQVYDGTSWVNLN